MKNNAWIFSPSIGVGPFLFGMGLDKAIRSFDLRCCGDLNEQLLVFFEEPDREKKLESGYGTSYKSESFDVELEFDENGRLSTIYDGESFVVGDIELIGSSVDCLDQLWDWRAWPIFDGGVCSIIECPGGMQVVVDDKVISRVTVDGASVLPG